MSTLQTYAELPEGEGQQQLHDFNVGFIDIMMMQSEGRRIGRRHSAFAWLAVTHDEQMHMQFEDTTMRHMKVIIADGHHDFAAVFSVTAL